MLYVHNNTGDYVAVYLNVKVILNDIAPRKLLKIKKNILLFL